MHRSIVFFVTIAMGLLACTAGGELPEQRQVAQGPINIEIVNQSIYEICYVHIIPEGVAVWGDDQLGGTDVLTPGATRVFQVTGGSYDVVLRDCAEIPVLSVTSIASDTHIVAGGEGAVALLVDNQSTAEICAVYISPLASEDWGQNVLGATEIIGPAAKRIVYLEPASYDLLAEDCEGNALALEQGAKVTDDVTIWNLME